MFYRPVITLALMAPLLVACGGADGDEEKPPTVAASRPSVATPGGGISGTLVWRQAPYLHTASLPQDAVAADDLERLGEAEVGPESEPQEVFHRAGGMPWELLSPGADGWLLWQPLAVVEARRQLADRLGVAVEQIEARDVEEAEWPDSCLGAAAPGEVCAEVITPGFRIDLAAGGDEYEYRSDRGGHVRPAP